MFSHVIIMNSYNAGNQTFEISGMPGASREMLAKCGESKREHRRLLYKTLVSGLHLQTKVNHGIREREGEAFICVYG